ncbi:MAG: response regulator transcription factor [Gammaproteobacteria bacterium]|nr:response regulator transcription factor [Gammaproteobacteria bacterium]
MKILVIEDNPDILANMVDYLDEQGYLTDPAQDGISGLHFAVTRPYDLIILDLMLPGIDGLTLCKRLRNDAHIQTPIIMVTARDTLTDKLLGFESGADDYLVKPFSLVELEARIKAILKRGKNNNNSLLSVADLSFNPQTFEVQRNQQPIKLNPIALKLLEALMRASPHVLKREQLEDEIWGDNPCDSDALKTHIHHLRQAIDKPFKYPLLHTIRKIGYRLAENS